MNDLKFDEKKPTILPKKNNSECVEPQKKVKKFTEITEPPLLPKILNKNIPPEDPPCVPPVPPVPLPEGLTHTQTHSTDPSVPPCCGVKKVKTSFLAVKPGFSLCWSASQIEKSRDDAVTGEPKLHQPTKRETLKKENYSMNNDVDRLNDVEDNGREDKECVQDDTVSVKGKILKHRKYLT